MSEEEAKEQLQELTDWLQDLLYDDELKCSTKVRYIKRKVQHLRQIVGRLNNE